MFVFQFLKQNKDDAFKMTLAICHWGNSKWKQRPREEQAETDGTEECEKVAHLLGVDSADLIKGLLKPRIKVGNEYVNKGQNQTQVVNSIGALSKSIYSRMFQWLVDKVNETLDVKTKRQFFIGVLDIAGFEIFDVISFVNLFKTSKKYINILFNFNNKVQRLRAAVHQLHQRETAAVLQPPHVRVGAGRVQEGGYRLGDDELRSGLAGLH